MREGVISAGVEQPLLDVRLRSSAHGATFHVTAATSTVDRKAVEADVEEAMRVVFVHGACVRDGSWWWHRTAELLQERGC